MTYEAPLKDMMFVLDELCGLEGLSALPAFTEATPDTIAAILEQAAAFTAGVLAPINHSGDKSGAKWTEKGVLTAPGWKDAYNQFKDGGWNGVVFSPEYGGMGLPRVVAASIQEMLNASNMSFGNCPLLTQGAIEAIELNGSDALKAAYLPRMVSGEWTGTMNLTEPQAGSDLAAVKTRAVRKDGHYLITGQKIFITYGDHDLTPNIIHLVLARVAGAPEGVKGLSLFVVPKILVNADGTLGAANDVRCVSIEHKLGLHAGPTAVMAYGDNGGAKGFLVGEENRGLEYMFVMMNQARLSVGIQGLGIADRAYQRARAYAHDRIQGRIIGDTSNAPKPIAYHPDVHRMLMTMRAKCEAMRALAYTAAHSLDLSQAGVDEDTRRKHQARLELLIPVVKGWCTETACDVASLGVQVHGGMGYIEETGAAQHFRDARITTIYEGTTAIQANDFIGRKMQRDDAAAARAMIVEIREIENELSCNPDETLKGVQPALSKAAAAMERSVDWLMTEGRKNPVLAAAQAVHVLHMFGLTISGALLAKSAARAAVQKNSARVDALFLEEKIAVARYFAGQVLLETEARLAAVLDPGASALALYPLSK